MVPKLSLLFLSLYLLALSHCYINPVQSNKSSPDPGVVYDGHNYYAVTTGGWDGHTFPIWQSKDLFTWSHQGFIFMSHPSWGKDSFWAPEIHIIGHSYNAYYTARDSTGHLCIGVATSDKPTGPYIDKGGPLLRNATEGVIDATIYKFANGTVYLIYKVDGNAHGKPTEIHAVQLTADGKSLSGSNHLLFRDTLSWEHGIVEGPWVTFENNTFYIFYSGCGYASKCYAVGVAKSANFFGPYEKHPTPILHTKDPEDDKSWQGPGHCSVVKSLKGNYAMVYHAWPHGQIGTKRVMLVDQVTFEGGWPKVRAGYPTQSTQSDF